MTKHYPLELKKKLYLHQNVLDPDQTDSTFAFIPFNIFDTVSLLNDLKDDE